MSRKPQPTAIRSAIDAAERLDHFARTLDHGGWQRRVERLYRDLLANESAKLERAPQMHVQEWLPFYVYAEQNKEPADTLYPEIARHLAECQECQAAYEMQRIAFMPSIAAKTPPPAKTRKPKQTRTAWERIEFPGEANQPSRFQFKIPLTVWKPPASQVPAFRDNTREAESLILSDQILFDNQSIVVQAWLAPSSAQNDTYDLRVVLASPQPLARRVRTRLDWGKHHYESGLKGGQAQFKQLARVAPKSSISITLESTSNERSRRPETPRPAKRQRRAAR